MGFMKLDNVSYAKDSFKVVTDDTQALLLKGDINTAEKIIITTTGTHTSGNLLLQTRASGFDEFSTVLTISAVGTNEYVFTEEVGEFRLIADSFVGEVESEASLKKKNNVETVATWADRPTYDTGSCITVKEAVSGQGGQPFMACWDDAVGDYVPMGVVVVYKATFSNISVQPAASTLFETFVVPSSLVTKNITAIVKIYGDSSTSATRTVQINDDSGHSILRVLNSGIGGYTINNAISILKSDKSTETITLQASTTLGTALYTSTVFTTDGNKNISLYVYNSTTEYVSIDVELKL